MVAVDLQALLLNRRRRKCRLPSAAAPTSPQLALGAISKRSETRRDRYWISSCAPLYNSEDEPCMPSPAACPREIFKTMTFRIGILAALVLQSAFAQGP